MSKGENGIGFSGLSSLTSDVDEAGAGRAGEEVENGPADTGRRGEPEWSRRTAAPTPTRATAPKLDPEVVASGTSRTPPSSASGARLVWGLVGIVVLTWLINVSQEDDGPPSRAPADTPTYPSDSYAPSATAGTRLSELEFSVPPVGDNNVLSVAEIRWCLREDIRIEVLRPLATSNSQIDQFNGVVGDYNERCGSFRYMEGALTWARREVERVRAEIVASVRPPW